MSCPDSHAIERRHHLHQVTIDDVLALLADVPDGHEVAIRTGISGWAAQRCAARMRGKLGVDFVVRYDPKITRTSTNTGDRVFSVYVRRRTATEPIVRGTAVRPGPHWRTVEDVMSATGYHAVDVSRYLVHTGKLQGYRFGQRILFRAADFDRLMATEFAEVPGGAITARPTTEGNPP